MNLPALAAKLQSMGIMGKAFIDLSREEAEAMVRACWDILEPTDAKRLPCWLPRLPGRLERELSFPFDCPSEFKAWLEPDGWIRLYRVLEMMGATDEEKNRYLGLDWKERMHKRTQFSQNPCCPVCGGAITKEEKAA